MPALYHFKSDQFKENLLLGGTQHMVSGRLCQYLKGWQLDGLRFLYKHFEKGEACILNDEGGLGKVVTVSVFLGTVLTNDTTKKCLIVVRDDEHIEGWRFHLSVLTQLTVKVIERTSDINHETVFLVKWSTLKNISDITKTTFDHIIIDNRGEMLTNKFCTGILLRYYENKVSIIISSVDVTSDIKLLHILLRLCGRLDRQYTDVKAFEDKFELPKLKEGVRSKVDLEDYFLKREKVINFCRDFRLRRYCHQFEEDFPLVPSNDFKKHLEQWRSAGSSQSSGSVKLLSSSSEKDIEELFKAYFQVKKECDSHKLESEVQRLPGVVPMDNDELSLSEDLVMMSPLLFVSESESDSEQTQLNVEEKKKEEQGKEGYAFENEKQNRKEFVVKEEKESPLANRRILTKPVKRLTREAEDLLSTSSGHRKALSGRKSTSTEEKHKQTKEQIASSKDFKVVLKRGRKPKAVNDEKANNGSLEKQRKQKKNQQTQEVERKESVSKDNANSKKDAEKNVQSSKKKSEKATNVFDISIVEKEISYTKADTGLKEVPKQDKLSPKQLKLISKDKEEESAKQAQGKPQKDKPRDNKLEEQKLTEKKLKHIDTPKKEDSVTKKMQEKLTKEKKSVELKKESKNQKSANDVEEKKNLKNASKLRDTDSAKKKDNLESSATLELAKTKQAKEDENKRRRAQDEKTLKEIKVKKKGRKGFDLILYEAKKFLNNKHLSSKGTTEEDIVRKAKRRKSLPDESKATKESNISPTRSRKSMPVKKSPTTPHKSPEAQKNPSSNKKDKIEIKKGKPFTVYTPLGVHSRSTRGMDRFTRSSSAPNKYMKVSVAQVSIEKKARSLEKKSAVKRLQKRPQSVSKTKVAPEKIKPQPPSAPLFSESPAILESMQLGQALTPTNNCLVADFNAPPKNADYDFPLMLDKDISDSECLVTSEIPRNNDVIILSGSSSSDNEMEPPKSTVSRRKTTTKPPMVTIPRPVYNKAKSPDLFSTCSDFSLPCSQQPNSKHHFEGFKIFGSELRQSNQPRSCLEIIDRMFEPRTAIVAKKKSAPTETRPASSPQQHCIENEDAMFEITSNGTFGNIVRVNSSGEISPVRNKNQSTQPTGSNHPKNRITNYLISSNQRTSGAASPSSLEDTSEILPKTPKRRKSLSGTVKRSPRSLIGGGPTQTTKLTQWLVKNASMTFNDTPPKALVTKRRRLDLSFPDDQTL